ncbi:MAG TPA: hypothetical protein EYN91_21370 [Candidatus Melainabacteria bacterium]|nr:hypothetical protein [Candidatus Melainabacteria bacterium]HIN66429.1 hypothetical protein [Candidatus Obscuribacterales bacterium]
MPRDRISLQILFDKLPKFSERELNEAASNVSHSAPAFRYQLPKDTSVRGEGIAATDAHKVKLNFCDKKLDEQELAQINAHLRLVPDASAAIKMHNAYIDLSVEPNPEKPLQAYHLLTFLACMIAVRGGLAIANINGFTSFSAQQLLQLFGDDDWLDAIANMPPLFLFSGPVVHEFDDNPALWMRSYGNHLLGIPDLGTFIPPEIVQEYVPMTLQVFDNIMTYMIESGTQVEPGHTMETESVLIKVCEQQAKPDEFYFQSPTGLLRIEYTPRPGFVMPRFS